MTEENYGWVVNTYYDWINMLTKMQKNNPRRFKEFNYSKTSFYYYLDRLQHEQNLQD